MTGNATNAANANGTVLNDHRFPRNGGQVKVQRRIVDLFTGRRVAPYQIEPGYLARVVGINPSVDALNNSPRNGSTVCQIVATDYANDNSVTLDLDAPAVVDIPCDHRSPETQDSAQVVVGMQGADSTASC